MKKLLRPTTFALLTMALCFTACENGTHHPMDYIERRTEKEYAYPVTIGEDCWIGGGAILCPGVTIGDRCIIGAGSVVTKDIPSDSIAVGNPAKVIRKNEAKK